MHFLVPLVLAVLGAPKALSDSGIWDSCYSPLYEASGTSYTGITDNPEKIASLGKGSVFSPSQTFETFLQSNRWAGEMVRNRLAKASFRNDPLLQSKLNFKDSHRNKGKELLKSLGLSAPLVIHPGSGSPAKNAPLSFFQKAAHRAVEESKKTGSGFMG